MSLIPGNKFGRLTTVEFAGWRIQPSGQRKRQWKCVCVCGNQTIVAESNLKMGITTSCGCYHKERTSESHTTHGCTKGKKVTPEFKVWAEMIQRCGNPNNSRYADYGGRGIAVCAAWFDFAVFLKDMGSRPSSKHCIERVNNNGNYEPKNCKWATLVEQGRNKRNNHLITANGKTMPLSAWEEQSGISADTIAARLKLGWNPDHAVTRPTSYNHTLPHNLHV